MPRRRTRTRRRSRSAPLIQVALRHAIESLEPRLFLSTYTVTTAADSGPGSLRDAIQNSAADTIHIGVSGAITIQSQLEITRNLSIAGPSSGSITISGRSQSRVLMVDAGVTAEIDGVTISGGRAPDGALGPPGGTWECGGRRRRNCQLREPGAKERHYFGE